MTLYEAEVRSQLIDAEIALHQAAKAAIETTCDSKFKRNLADLIQKLAHLREALDT